MRGLLNRSELTLGEEKEEEGEEDDDSEASGCDVHINPYIEQTYKKGKV